jgi:hypothetical protein
MRRIKLFSCILNPSRQPFPTASPGSETGDPGPQSVDWHSALNCAVFISSSGGYSQDELRIAAISALADPGGVAALYFKGKRGWRLSHSRITTSSRISSGFAVFSFDFPFHLTPRESNTQRALQKERERERERVRAEHVGPLNSDSEKAMESRETQPEAGAEAGLETTGECVRVGFPAPDIAGPGVGRCGDTQQRLRSCDC